MDIQITRHGINLGERQLEYLNEKVEKALKAGGRFDEESTSVKIDLRKLQIKTEDNVSVEITIFTKGAVIRAEERALTIEAAIDLAEEKIRKQMRRYKERYQKRRRNEQWIPTTDLAENIPNDEPRISKRKRFSNNHPIHEEEAIELMELSGHDFFLFNNIETGRWSVVYKRHGASYGIIEPKLDDEK